MKQLTEQAKALYLYGFSLVVTEITHWGSDDKSFHHLRTFPTDKVNKIVKMNNDTLYSTAWTQLARTSYLVHIPKITERYYLFPILDAYTNVVASIGTQTPEQQQALTKGSRLGFAEMQAGKRNPKYTIQHRGWLSVIGGVGNYGTDYLQRAETAYGGWGANIIQDSAYVIATADDSGAPLESKNHYRLHISANGYPHASVFWSITLYGEPSKYLVSNPIGR